MLDERNALKFVNRKYFPFILGGGLCAITLIFITLVFVMRKYDLIVSIAGIEILLYMIMNCVGGLLVSKIKPYFKLTVVAFLLNFAIVALYSYLLLGSKLADYREYSPILEAFIFSFFGSFILVALIRNVVNFLKE
jgi:hypothetical protein